MQIYKKVSDVRNYVILNKKEGKTIGFVPTMGCLHEGHLSLISMAKEQSDIIIVSIFVNPLQFGPGEDYGKYPRELENDIEKLKKIGVNALFHPDVNEMYGDNMTGTTYIEVPVISQKLCGAYRPGHFRGVATIVAKLLNCVPADKAYFGAKDWQQQLIIKKMVHDLNINMKIVACPIIRERDGLAMSSRNEYLAPEDRKTAARLYESLKAAANAYDKNITDVNEIKSIIENIIQKEPRKSDLKIQYLEICDPETLEAVDQLTRGVLIAMAVFIGEVRLIDNWIIGQNL
ncbi:MAG: pantoate--beta-alanine ligase [Candidatus Margulisiibacteriota bacterium]